jgi:hypothetical protein
MINMIKYIKNIIANFLEEIMVIRMSRSRTTFLQ